ncbi:class I SAM-dependent methyltransferase [Streptomyces albus]|uniref:Class I SAM-dependent methyltransferase n=1 Tax=Streptomyces albus TaxID=1888 RepID=A0A8H1LNE3_9ACTN|nr:class I SAM-dependent methyltransferase [Streptomyces albus]
MSPGPGRQPERPSCTVRRSSPAESAGDRAPPGDRGPARRNPYLRPRRQALVLTVDFTRFPLAAGDRVLDLGCGAGRHAFECYRRGAQVVALDRNGEEIREVAKWFAAMKEAGEAPEGATATAMEGDALNLPFPDDSFDVVIISEVMEHIPDTRARRP